VKRQHGRFRHNGILLSILVVLLSVAPGAAAAESSPTTRPTDLTLSEPYVDRSFGFSIAAPISSRWGLLIDSLLIACRIPPILVVPVAPYVKAIP